MSQRNKNDFYPTQHELALAIVRRLAEILPTPSGIIEPSAGTGAFIQAALQVWPHVLMMAVEIDKNMQSGLHLLGSNVIIGDWVEVIKDERDLDVLILGNPPFSSAREHISAGMTALGSGCFQAMLLRMSFMGSRERLPFWKEFPARYLIPLVPRPSFTGGGNDNSEYGVFVWQKGHRGSTELLPTLVWR